MITVSSDAALSVGGAYYKDYTLEDREYKVGEIVKATITDHRGPNSNSYEVDLEITEDLLKALESQREEKSWEKHLAELSAKRPTLLAFQLADTFDSLSDIMNARENFNMHSEIRDAVDRGGYIQKHFIDEDGNEMEDGDEWSDEYDEERYEREIYEYIAKMSIEDIKSFLCYDCLDWRQSDIEDLKDKIQRMEDNDETDTEEYEYACKLYNELPDIAVLLTEEEAAEYEAPKGSGYDIEIDGFGYLQMDSI